MRDFLGRVLGADGLDATRNSEARLLRVQDGLHARFGLDVGDDALAHVDDVVNGVEARFLQLQRLLVGEVVDVGHEGHLGVDDLAYCRAHLAELVEIVIGRDHEAHQVHAGLVIGLRKLDDLVFGHLEFRRAQSVACGKRAELTVQRTSRRVHADLRVHLGNAVRRLARQHPAAPAHMRPLGSVRIHPQQLGNFRFLEALARQTLVYQLDNALIDGHGDSSLS